METKEHIQLFRSLFQGREDVFAIRWEKPARTSGGGNKSGYMPAYFYDPYQYRLNKINGGSFKDFAEKSYLPLSDEQISKHLFGQQFIGIYPLLKDNTSWFISAEFENDILVAQMATSKDLDRIDSEIMESVRFRFVERRFFARKSNSGEEESDVEDQDQIQKLYPSEHELLEEILSKRNAKHFRQLRYLADNHVRSIVKLRFVLSPFSFVFLMSAKHQYHIVLETLDTEEATYIWHFDKNISSLKKNLELVDSDLNTIKNEGRQVLLESQTINFSRIIHDYSDDKKGYIQWRDLLEEKLY